MISDIYNHSKIGVISDIYHSSYHLSLILSPDNTPLFNTTVAAYLRYISSCFSTSQQHMSLKQLRHHMFLNDAYTLIPRHSSPVHITSVHSNHRRDGQLFAIRKVRTTKQPKIPFPTICNSPSHLDLLHLFYLHSTENPFPASPLLSHKLLIFMPVSVRQNSTNHTLSKPDFLNNL